MSAIAEPARSAPEEAWLSPRVAAGMLVALAGSAGFLVMPMVITALRAMAVAEGWIGLIGSADPTGMFIGAAIALTRPIRARPRSAAVLAMIVALGCNAASLAVREPAALMLLRLAAGTSSGIALAVGLSALAASRLPDRSFAQFTLAQMLFGAFVAWIGDAGLGGLDVIYVCMFGLQIAGLAAALTIRAAGADAAAEGAPKRLDWRLAGYTLAANVLNAGGFLMLWTNIQAASVAAGFAPEAGVMVINAGLVGGFAGAMGAILIDARTHRRTASFILFALGLAGIAAIAWTTQFELFLAAVFLLQLSTTAAFFGFGAVSEADPAGRLSVTHILAVKAGFGTAPVVASTLLVSYGLDAVIALAFAATLFSMLIFQQLISRAERVAAVT